MREFYERGIPEAVRNHIWQVFFLETLRGVSFSAHIPWADEKDTHSVFMTDQDGEVVASAILRESKQPRVGMIGYVGVRSTLRGRGLGRNLMKLVTLQADNLGFAAVILWTKTPNVYTEHGFKVLRRDLVLSVKAIGGPVKSLSNVQSEQWPLPDSRSGLPAFASRGMSLSDQEAQATVVWGSLGATLVDWVGEPSSVGALLHDAGLSEWILNVSVGDCFADGLPLSQFSIERSLGAFEMVRFRDREIALEPVSMIRRI